MIKNSSSTTVGHCCITGKGDQGREVKIVQKCFQINFSLNQLDKKVFHEIVCANWLFQTSPWWFFRQVCGIVKMENTWDMSLVQAAFSCMDGATRWIVIGWPLLQSQIILKSRPPKSLPNSPSKWTTNEGEKRVN